MTHRASIAPLDALEQRLVDGWQRGFPLVPRPYAAIASALGSTERDVIAAVARRLADGVVSRVGAVFRPNVVGASTLAAIAVPPERLAEVARLVSAHEEVNHNYEREHAYNLWFVATAPDAAHLDAALAAIERESGLAVIRLPLVRDYWIDLGFDVNATGTHVPPVRRVAPPVAPLPLTERDRRIYAAAYAQKGAMAAGFEVFRAFERDAPDFAKLAERKLPMPMLVLTGEKASGEFLIQQARLVADKVEGVVIKGAGHWLIDEAPGQVVPKLVEFLNR